MAPTVPPVHATLMPTLLFHGDPSYETRVGARVGDGVPDDVQAASDAEWARFLAAMQQYEIDVVARVAEAGS